jgi:hypothetical protein
MRFDVARFRQDDAHELVIASLACPLCLYSDGVQWELRSDGYDPSVECACPRCEERWCVFMTPDQALRLGLIELGAA